MNRGKQHIDEELLIRYIAGDVSDSESASIEQLIAQSNEYKTQYEQLKKVWAATKDPTKVAPADVNVDFAWKNIKSRMDQLTEIEDKHTGKQRSLTFYFTRVAAVVILGILIYSMYKYQSNTSAILLTSNDSTLIDKPLPDGTILALNQNTTIEYQKEFSETERRVKLSGEAFFDVEPDATRPFIIEAQDAIITVVGTEFNVKALENDIAVEVLVEEGIVELANPDKSESTRLQIGEKGIYIRETQEVKKETEIDVESLFWLNKTLLFRDTELSVVFETLERLYNVKIKVNDPTVLRCLLTAKFSNESVDHIIDHISTIFELEIIKDGKNIMIKGNGCP